MAFKYNTRNTSIPATKAIPGRESEMVQNDGGGVSFKTSDMVMLDRFLNIGADCGTAYLSKEENGYRNYSNVIRCIKNNGTAVVNRIAEVSSKGLAHKNDHAIFALALVFAHGNNDAKKLAVEKFNSVVRIGTHMFMFCEFIKGLRGFGKLVRSAINNWYAEKSDYGFTYQVTKYQNRNGWTHKDVFRLSHPKFDGRKEQLSKIVFGSEVPNTEDESSKLLEGIAKIKNVIGDKEAAKIVAEYKLEREHIPTHFLNSAAVQASYLYNLKGTALLRNLGNMTKSGLIAANSNAAVYVVNKFLDREFIKSNRLHPLTIMSALRTYSSGSGLLGSNTWNPVASIRSALEKAFYSSFDLVEPTNKRFVYGVDISGSMTTKYNNMNMSCHEIATILALVHAKTENHTLVGGFSDDYVDLNISGSDTYETALIKTQNRRFGCTNPSSMFNYVRKHNINADCFIVITDNDINSGSQPSVELEKYRKQSKIDSKFIVCGLVANNFSMCDPNDPNSMDIAGFSPDITSVISNFVRG